MARVWAVNTALFIAAFVVWCAAALWVSVIDWRTGLIPRVIVWPATLIVAICLLVISLLERDPRRFGIAVLGGVAIGAFLLLFYVLRPGKIGGGDVRLVTLNGLIAGWWGLGLAWWSLFAGAFVMLPVALAKVAMTTAQVRKEARSSPAKSSGDSESREGSGESWDGLLADADRQSSRRLAREGNGESWEALDSGAPNGGKDGSDAETAEERQDNQTDGQLLAGSDAEEVSGSENSDADIQHAKDGADDSPGKDGPPQSAVRQGLNTTLRAGPWLCAGTLAVVIYAWVENGIV